jgi:hypothetical protein
MQTFSGLADGVYTFSARTAGAYAGYQSSVQFTVGAVAPRTSIVAAPVATSSAVTTLRTARFAWVSAGDVTFGCSLVHAGAAGAYAPCVSPQCVRRPDATHVLQAWQLKRAVCSELAEVSDYAWSPGLVHAVKKMLYSRLRWSCNALAAVKLTFSILDLHNTVR